MQNTDFSIEATLEHLKIDALNDMQVASLEAFNTGNDIVLLSATGSGKTLAFLLPLVQHADTSSKKTQAMIIVPSRELAMQIEQVWRRMVTGLKITCCYGGHKRETEENNLIQPPAVLAGTPGRIADHIRRGSITVDTIETLVLDEFDKSLEMGFQEEMAFIIGSLPALKKRMLTSATDAVAIPDFVKVHDPLKLDFLGAVNEKSIGLAIKMVRSAEKDKVDTLFRLICTLGSKSAIVFCNHRESVERTSELLHDKGIYNEWYHGAMEQRDRDSALSKFRNGSTDVLITTDLAARGLDIPNIRYIIHFHLPHTEDSFIHRNGRTARMEASGTAILILSDEEKLPDYIDKAGVEEIKLADKAVVPEKPKWTTFFIGLGKKDKVNKIDIVGFMSKIGELKQEDIGLIEVKDFFSFVAVKKIKASHTLLLTKNEKIKNKKAKIEIAK